MTPQSNVRSELWERSTPPRAAVRIKHGRLEVVIRSSSVVLRIIILFVVTTEQEKSCFFDSLLGDDEGMLQQLLCASLRDRVDGSTVSYARGYPLALIAMAFPKASRTEHAITSISVTPITSISVTPMFFLFLCFLSLSVSLE